MIKGVEKPISEKLKGTFKNEINLPTLGFECMFVLKIK